MPQPTLTRDSKKAAFPQMLEKHMGIITNACLEMELERSTYYHWRKTDSDFAARCDEVIEYTGDMVESELYKKIKAGDTACIIFYCKTKLKSRGYVERFEQTGKDGAPIAVSKFDAQDEEIVQRALQREIKRSAYVKPADIIPEDIN